MIVLEGLNDRQTEPVLGIEKVPVRTDLRIHVSTRGAVLTGSHEVRVCHSCRQE